MFSKRSAHDPRPNALTLALNGERDRGRSLLDLTVSNPTSAGIPFASEAILRALGRRTRPRVRAGAVRASLGARSGRGEIRAGGSGVHAVRIVLTASTSEAYAFLFKLLADPGD